eukprot:266265-Amphidinium_carterae.1
MRFKRPEVKEWHIYLYALMHTQGNFRMDGSMCREGRIRLKGNELADELASVSLIVKGDMQWEAPPCYPCTFDWGALGRSSSGIPAEARRQHFVGLPKADGGGRQDHRDRAACGWAHGNWFDPEKVKQGREEEICWIVKQNLFTYAPESECYEQQGKPYTLKWIDKMKGERCRSRLVAREIKRNKRREE